MARLRTLKANVSLGVVLAVTLAMILTAGVFASGFPSTNELNRNQQVPGREGQDAPHVNQVEQDIGEVTLEFVNLAPGLAFFEYRVDGEVLTTGNEHPVVDENGAWDPTQSNPDRDVIYPGVAVQSGNTEVMAFEANSTVEVRLALGGERDWDFDWVTFEALPDAQNKGDCKDGGWEDFGFKNQGQCIQFVNTGKDSR